MKTYTKTIEEARLVIEHDKYASSPRSDENLGYFITVERNRVCPDGAKFPDIEAIVRETGDVVASQEAHIEEIKKGIAGQLGETVLAIYPVYRYEHGNAVYRLGNASGFDYSNCGFYIVTDKSAAAYQPESDDYEDIIKGELELYTSWANGEVYRFTLFDENGVEEDACGGFYGIDEIKDALPDEWKGEDMREYEKA